MSATSFESIQNQLRAIGQSMDMVYYVWHSLNGRDSEAASYLAAEHKRIADEASILTGKNNEPNNPIETIERSNADSSELVSPTASDISR